MTYEIYFILFYLALEMIAVIFILIGSIRLKSIRRQLEQRERELDKVEIWLDNRERKLEKKLDEMRIVL